MSENCKICGSELRRSDAKYCGACSSVFYNLKNQKRFKNAAPEQIEQEVKIKRAEQGRSNCGRKPAFLKVRYASAQSTATAC